MAPRTQYPKLTKPSKRSGELKLVTVRIRYLRRRLYGGLERWYWIPSQELREDGWPVQRLSDDQDEAIAQATRINTNLDEWYASGKETPGPREGTVADLIGRYLEDDRYTSLAAKTRLEYGKHLELIKEVWGDLAVKSITRPAVMAYREQFRDRPHWGNAVLRTLRIVFGHAVDLGWITLNPAAKPRQFKVSPRDQVWTHEQERRFVEKAYELSLPSMALGLAMGIYTAQREGDIVRFSWSKYDGEWIHRWQQRKTGKRLDIPVLSQLRAAIEGAPKRATVILTTETGRGYTPNHFRHCFRKVILGCGLDGLQFRDLRRTAVVRMGEAGLDATKIAQITGHTYDHTLQILETYMPRNKAMAAQAASVMEEYYRRLRGN